MRPTGAALAAAVLALTMAACGGQQTNTRAVRLPADSMAPTFKRGAVVSYTPARTVKVGDVVVFHPPSGYHRQAECAAPDEGLGTRRPCATATSGASSALLLKRIVAIGGDRIAIHDGRVIRNGTLAAEPYIKPCHDPDLCDYPGTIRVPPNSYYLLGDNRGESEDSRFFGPVVTANVVGKAITLGG